MCITRNISFHFHAFISRAPWASSLLHDISFSFLLSSLQLHADWLSFFVEGDFHCISMISLDEEDFTPFIFISTFFISFRLRFSRWGHFLLLRREVIFDFFFIIFIDVILPTFSMISFSITPLFFIFDYYFHFHFHFIIFAISMCRAFPRFFFSLTFSLSADAVASFIFRAVEHYRFRCSEDFRLRLSISSFSMSFFVSHISFSPFIIISRFLHFISRNIFLLFIFIFIFDIFSRRHWHYFDLLLSFISSLLMFIIMRFSSTFHVTFLMVIFDDIFIFISWNIFFFLLHWLFLSIDAISSRHFHFDYAFATMRLFLLLFVDANMM